MFILVVVSVGSDQTGVDMIPFECRFHWGQEQTKNMILILKVIEYIVPDDLLEELGIDEMTFDELKALFELFDLDRWHFFVFTLSESSSSFFS